MLVDLARHASDHGTRLLVAFLDEGPLVHAVAAHGADVEVIPAGRLRHPRRAPPAVARLARLLRRARVDVAVSWMSKAHLYGAPAGRASGVATVLNHLEPRAGNWLRLATALPSAGVITVSDDLAAYVGRLRPRLPVRAVRPGVELDRFNPDALPRWPRRARRSGCRPTCPLSEPSRGCRRRACMSHRRHAQRARGDAGRALRRGRRSHTEPDYEPYLRHRVAELRLEAVVRFAGFRTEIPLWRHAMGRERQRVRGRAVQRRCARGDGAGQAGHRRRQRWDAEDHRRWRQRPAVPFGDAQSLAAAVRRLLADPARAASMGQAARRSVQGLSTVAFAERLVAAARELRDSDAR